MIKKYYNLGQWIGHRLCYFRSTDIEQKNYNRLLWCVTDEMLYFLSKGDTIIINEKSIKAHGKIERIFVPVLNDFLNYLYFKKEPGNKHLKHHFNYCLEAVLKDKQLLKRFEFWRKRTKKEVKIICKTKRVKIEPNVIYK